MTNNDGAMSDKPENIYKSPIKGIVIGIICIAIAIWFWLGLVGNPFDELALIRGAETTDCYLTDYLIGDNYSYLPCCLN